MAHPLLDLYCSQGKELTPIKSLDDIKDGDDILKIQTFGVENSHWHMSLVRHKIGQPSTADSAYLEGRLFIAGYDPRSGRYIEPYQSPVKVTNLWVGIDEVEEGKVFKIH
jgi:hypothetical protein